MVDNAENNDQIDLIEQNEDLINEATILLVSLIKRKQNLSAGTQQKPIYIIKAFEKIINSEQFKKSIDTDDDDDFIRFIDLFIKKIKNKEITVKNDLEEYLKFISDEYALELTNGSVRKIIEDFFHYEILKKGPLEASIWLSSKLTGKDRKSYYMYRKNFKLNFETDIFLNDAMKLINNKIREIYLMEPLSD